MCSTPVGIIEGNTPRQKERSTSHESAQRLSASSKETREPLRACLHRVCVVLNACRHHRRKHGDAVNGTCTANACSTPVGIIEGNTARLPTSIQLYTYVRPFQAPPFNRAWTGGRGM